MSRVYQDALDALLADFDWTHEGLHDYYGRRADDLDAHMSAMKERGIRTRRGAAKEGHNGRVAA